MSSLYHTSGIQRKDSTFRRVRSSSTWKSAHVKTGKKLGLSRWFKRNLVLTTSLDLTFGIPSDNGLHPSHDNMSSFNDSISMITEESLSFVGNVTPQSKIKTESSTASHWRLTFRDYSSKRSGSQRHERRRAIRRGLQKLKGFTPNPVRSASELASMQSSSSIILRVTSSDKVQLKSPHACLTEPTTALHSPLNADLVGNDKIKKIYPGTSTSVLQIPEFSPVLALDYDMLEELRENVFGVPDFSDSLDTISYSDASDERLNAHLTVQPDLSQSSSSLHLQKSSTGLDVIGENIDEAVSETTSSAEYMDSTASPTFGEQLSASPESCGGPETSSDSNTLLQTESSLTSCSADPNTQLYPSVSFAAVAKNGGTLTLQRARSVLDKVRSAIFVGDHILDDHEEPDIEVASTDSSYTPVPISVPTIRKPTFLGELVDTITIGVPIDKVYVPDNPYNSVPSLDENIPLSFTDSNFFEPLSRSSHEEHQEPSPSGEMNSSLRFDKFAQVLFYNNASSIRSSTTAVKPFDHAALSCTDNLQNKYKERGSLRLNPKVKTRCLSLSRLATLSSPPSQTDMSAINHNITLSTEAPKSILKSKLNKNVDQESLRVADVDNVGIWEFMEDFDVTENQRLESAPYLEGLREKQLVTYYSDYSNDHLIKLADVQLDCLTP